MQLYSVQIEGPIMPHALAQMCLLLDESSVEYSAAVATVKATTSFTSVHVEQGLFEEGEKNGWRDVRELFCFVLQNLWKCRLLCSF